jgi:hypothetical protein
MIGLKCNKCGFVNNAEFNIHLINENSAKKRGYSFLPSMRSSGH